jgi:hypothetical protein
MYLTHIDGMLKKETTIKLDVNKYYEFKGIQQVCYFINREF